MRRSDKEITEFAEKLKVLDRCDVIRLGMVDDGKAYVVPVNFGYNVENGQISIYSFISSSISENWKTAKVD